MSCQVHLQIQEECKPLPADVSNIFCSRVLTSSLLQVKGTTIKSIKLHYPMRPLQLISHQWQMLQTVCLSRSPSVA